MTVAAVLLFGVWPGGLLDLARPERRRRSRRRACRSPDRDALPRRAGHHERPQVDLPAVRRPRPRRHGAHARVRPRLGRAFATVAWDRVGRAPVLAVGRDNRPSGRRWPPACAPGSSRPAARRSTSDASHAGALFRGPRARRGRRRPGHRVAQSAGVQRLQDGARRRGLPRRGDPRSSGRSSSPSAGAAAPAARRATARCCGRYREGSCRRHRLARPVRVVVDCGNGAGSLIAVRDPRGLGAEVTPLFCESDGTFPNHHPDPTVPENLRDLQAEVRRTGAELGIAFDGDADRIGAVDETGRDRLRRPAAGHPRPRCGAALRCRARR